MQDSSRAKNLMTQRTFFGETDSIRDCENPRKHDHMQSRMPQIHPLRTSLKQTSFCQKQCDWSNMSHTFDNVARREARRQEREQHIARMEDMARPQLETLRSLSTLSPQEAVMQLPELGKRLSSRSLVDFDSQQLLSMEEIHDSVRQTASRLLNDDEVSSLEDDEQEGYDYPTHEEELLTSSPEDARMYAGLLLDKSATPKQSLVRNSTRKLMNLRGTIRAMKGPNDNSFVSSLDLMSSMEADEIPSKRTGMSGSRVVCIMGAILIAVLVAIIVALKSSGNLGPTPSSPHVPPGTTPQPPSTTPQDPMTPRMKAVVDYLAKNGVSDPVALNTVGTPQQKASDWIANTDSLLDANEEESRFVQRYVMAVFYYSLGGPDWKNQVDFLGMKDECLWSYESPTDNSDDVYIAGITCNAYSQVEKIMLPDHNLVGSLPSELSLLTTLELLALTHNQISGSIPDAYQSLKYLEGFELQYNTLTGTLPSFFGNMTELRVLSLSNNDLQGALPSSMSNMKHLTTLALDDNSFTGDMASAVNAMVSLKYLYADNNFFDNMIDDLFLAESPQLEEIDMSGNRFASNDLPAHFFMISHLRVLDLHDNDLAGRLPNDIPNQASLQVLDLSSNRLSGTIPLSIQQLSSLTHLDVSSNQFRGLIPYTFSSMRNLTYLFLSNNPLDEDPFPEFVAQLTNLKELSMAKHSSGMAGRAQQSGVT
jgi:Leucine-rich repeat (LRR) protein